MTIVPGLDLRVIYLAAGHRDESDGVPSSGGAHEYGLDEWRENIHTVEDALLYIHTHTALGLGTGAKLDAFAVEYDLGGVALVVIDHGYDLRDTIRVINADYRRRCAEWGVLVDWTHGACVECHFNWLTSKTAQGPMSIHFEAGPSKALGDFAAGVLAAVIGLPCRHWTNEQNIASRGWGYGFLQETEPLALLIECDEMHNPARSAIIGNAQSDNVYGAAVARFLLQLAGVEETAATEWPESQRGMHLGYGVPTDWDALYALKPCAIVTLDPSDLPDLPDQLYWGWRPWQGHRVVRDKTPRQYLDAVVAEWQAKGSPWFDGIIFLNEPNLELESGYPEGTKESADAVVVWGLEVVRLLRDTFDADIHSPPLSWASTANDMAYYEWMRPLVLACDVLDVHCYWHGALGLYGENKDEAAYRYHQVRSLYPHKPVFISECGRGSGHGSREYGEELAYYFAHLDDYVMNACPYIWTSPQGEWDGWRLQGTMAARVLAETAPVPLPEPDPDPVPSGKLKARIAALEGRADTGEAVDADHETRIAALEGFTELLRRQWEMEDED